MEKRPHPGSERPLRGSVQRFDLGEEGRRLRSERTYEERRRNAITLRKGEGMNVVLLAMGAGDRLNEHAAPGPFGLTVLEGRVRFEAAGEASEVGEGVLITCDAGVRHSVEALEDALCLLTVAGARSGIGGS
ncbi:hypothetical protein RxyAA322_05090 [Rubrobacter xylanophilus]|uniref:Cupin domain-containing protein n=1 Tax=Rubrobacter xylanophilus TaxID=49319 RepID=A0A510HHB6_9ACTN|nr:cupin domain-containing protein [Rubrobacter xylanophilus]BBL78655.1 hypothetical protein RxyAA322_05090 [Rubrobacter xylanophilus]